VAAELKALCDKETKRRRVSEAEAVFKRLRPEVSGCDFKEGEIIEV
jgi:hypothetical protein